MSEKSMPVDREQLPFTIIENPAIDDYRLRQSELLVYLSLCRHANAARECWPSYATLAREARCHRSTAIAAIKKLVILHYVEKMKRRDLAGDMTSCLYRVRALTQPKDGVVAQDDHVVAGDDHGSRPGRPGVVAQDDPNYIHLEQDTRKGERATPSLDLFPGPEDVEKLIARLKEVNTSLLMGAMRNDLLALLTSERADTIVAAYQFHQAKHPGKGFNLFLADFGVWKAKIPKAPRDPGPACGYCELHGGLHTADCKRPRHSNQAPPVAATG